MNQKVFVRIVYFLLFFIAYAGWSGCVSEDNKINSFAKLEGVWVMNLGETQIYEEWKKADEKSMAGISYEITEEDSTVSEHIQIKSDGVDIFYIPTVVDQNDGEPVSFKLTYQSDTLFVFENPAHDFPTKISYRFTGSDLLDATISGEIKGELRSLDFNYTRVR